MIEAMLQAERLLVMGMLDQAEELYRRAADTDPRNAMALVGLSRVASERGDDRQAYEHARRALEIDHENAAALRLEARLAEVLRARGEEVDRPAWVADEGGRRPSLPKRPAAAPHASAAPEDLARAAQRATFTSNPSMEDHRRRMETEQRPPTAPTSPAEDEGTRTRPGLLRRLLGR